LALNEIGSNKVSSFNGIYDVTFFFFFFFFF